MNPLCVHPDTTVECIDCEDGKVPTGAVVGSTVVGKVYFI
jgi:hypothetical protein